MLSILLLCPTSRSTLIPVIVIRALFAVLSITRVLPMADHSNYETHNERPAPRRRKSGREKPGRVKRGRVKRGRGKRFYLCLVLLFLMNLFINLEAVVLSPLLPTIAATLSASTNQIFWSGTGFLIGRTVFTPIFGAMSDIFGRRLCMLVAIALFTLGSLLCGVAPNIGAFITARVIQGIGAGGAGALVPIIISGMVELRERGIYTGLFALSQLLGLPSGIVLGGVLSQGEQWRWAFYMNLPASGIAFCGLWFCLRFEAPQAREPILRRLGTFDWIGVVLFTASIIPILMALTWGGTIYPWSSASTVVPLVLGGLGVVVFGAFEYFAAKNPFIPPRVFSNRTASISFLASFIQGYILNANAYYLIYYFIGSQEHTILRAAIDTLPGACTLVIASGSSGFIFSRLRSVQKILWGAWVLMTIGLALMSQLRRDSPQAAQYGLQVLASLGGGAILPGRLLAVQASQAVEADIPIATSVVVFLLSLGQTFGIGTGSAAIANQWQSLVDKAVAQHNLLPSQAVQSGDLAKTLPHLQVFPATVQAIYQDIVAESVSSLYIVLAALAGFGLLTSLAMKDVSLDKDGRQSQRFCDGKDQSTDNLTSDTQHSVDLESRLSLDSLIQEPFMADDSEVRTGSQDHSGRQLYAATNAQNRYI
ncbi:major facilitator superfamily domain-containing protein [Coniochaeta sp. 2T2.1]|nr:major facilitator superfamily domain-containing protein [Coniochaeta sp. 2T2.1]